MIGVYKIVNPVGQVYIGQSWDIEKRFKKDYKNATLCKNQPKLSASFLEHGIDNHVFKILFTEPTITCQIELNQWEQYYMDIHSLYKKELLNLRRAGNRGKHSPETIAKMKGRSGKWMIGKKDSDETKLKKSLSKKGIPKPPRSEQHCKNLSLSHIGIAINKGGVKVNQYSISGIFIREWCSLAEVTRVLGINRSNIVSVCRSQRNMAGGFVWKYINN